MFEYVQDAKLIFRGTPARRSLTRGIVLHHLAGWGEVESVHRDGLERGWMGIGYNLYVRRDGSAWWGRGLEAIGAHAGRTVTRNREAWLAAQGNNSETVGIGFEGYYHPGHLQSNAVMPGAQFDMGVRLIRDVKAHYPGIAFIRGHNQMPATATVCPGSYFPLADMIAAGEQPAAGGSPFVLDRLLKRTAPMQRGEDVKWLQGRLNAAGIAPALAEDGIFGDLTRAAVVAFQRQKGLSVDGIVGRQTVTALGGVWAK